MKISFTKYKLSKVPKAEIKIQLKNKKKQNKLSGIIFRGHKNRDTAVIYIYISKYDFLFSQSLNLKFCFIEIKENIIINLNNEGKNLRKKKRKKT